MLLSPILALSIERNLNHKKSTGHQQVACLGPPGQNEGGEHQLLLDWMHFGRPSGHLHAALGLPSHRRHGEWTGENYVTESGNEWCQFGHLAVFTWSLLFSFIFVFLSYVHYYCYVLWQYWSLWSWAWAGSSWMPLDA